MHSHALTTAWFLWRRHHWGMSAVLLWVVVLCAAHLALPPRTLEFAGNGLASLTFWLALFYAIAVFSYAADADVAGRGSGFPARMFTLPVPTVTLVIWPMIYGTVATAAIWVPPLIYDKHLLSESSFELILVVLFAAAYGTAYVGVSRARRGAGAERSSFARFSTRMANLLSRRQRPFTSLAQAQLWFEWR